MTRFALALLILSGASLSQADDPKLYQIPRGDSSVKIGNLQAKWTVAYLTAADDKAKAGSMPDSICIRLNLMNVGKESVPIRGYSINKKHLLKSIGIATPTDKDFEKIPGNDLTSKESVASIAKKKFDPLVRAVEIQDKHIEAAKADLKPGETAEVTFIYAWDFSLKGTASFLFDLSFIGEKGYGGVNVKYDAIDRTAIKEK